MDRQKWIKAFTESGIAPESAETYADIFVTEKKNTWENMALLDRPLLKELGVGVWGEILTIMGLSFAGLSQGQTESIQNYRIRLKSLAQDCDFLCSKCKHDLSEIYIKDQMTTRFR